MMDTFTKIVAGLFVFIVLGGTLIYEFTYKSAQKNPTDSLNSCQRAQYYVKQTDTNKALFYQRECKGEKQ